MAPAVDQRGWNATRRAWCRRRDDAKLSAHLRADQARRRSRTRCRGWLVPSRRRLRARRRASSPPPRSFAMSPALRVQVFRTPIATPPLVPDRAVICQGSRIPVVARARACRKTVPADPMVAAGRSCSFVGYRLLRLMMARPRPVEPRAHDGPVGRARQRRHQAYFRKLRAASPACGGSDVWSGRSASVPTVR